MKFINADIMAETAAKAREDNLQNEVSRVQREIETEASKGYNGVTIFETLREQTIELLRESGYTVHVHSNDNTSCYSSETDISWTLKSD